MLLIELGEAKVLVDVGSGNRFLDTAGRLMANLDAAGIDPINARPACAAMIQKATCRT